MDTEEETPGADESSDTSLIVLSSGEEGGDSSEWESETNEGEESYIEEREEREEKREAGDYSVGEERSDDEESVSLSSDKEGQQDSQLKLIRSEEDIMEDELGLGVGEEPVPLSRIEAEEAEQSALEHNDPSHHLHLPRQSEDISTQLEEVGQDEDTQRRRSQRLRDRSASPTIRATPIPTVTVACQDTPASPVVQNPPNTQPRPSTTSIPLNSTSTTLPRHDPRTSTPNSPYIPKSRFRTESIRSVASTAPATPAPADASASPHMNRRILDALRVPGLEETLARLQGLPGADVFFARLDEILAASNAVSTDQANEGAMHVDLDLDLDLEDRAHALEKETRRMRMELQDSRAALAMRGASGSTAENAPIHMDASLKDTLARLNREVAEARADLQGCEAEKRGLGALVAGRLRQLEDCAREMDAMRGDLARARERADVEAHVAASAQTETHRLALEAQTLRQSADRAAADALWLRDELARRDEALRSLRAQKAEADAAALARVEEAEAGWKAGAGRVRAVTGRAEAAEAQVQELMRSVEVERERRVSGEAALRNEMGAALRLVELHKADAARAREEAGEMKALIAEAERRCDVVVVERQEVERRVEELESLLKERDAAVVDLNRRCAVLDERAVGALETEAVGVLSPAAAAATALRKSGKSFTQVYVDYIALQDANARLTDEVGELHDSLNGVLSDLAERAPGIQQLASDKTLLEDEVTRLCSELQSAQLALNEDASSRDKAAALEKLNAVLEQEAHDLGRQVCHLLLELEGLRGGFGGSPTARLDRADPAAGSASGRVISERLVLFDNLVELQSQNRSLRSSLRSVSEALARVEGDVAGQVEERVEREMLESVGVLEEVREQLRAANARCETLVGEVEALRAAGEGAVVAGSFGASRFGTSWGSRPGTPGVGSRFGGDEFPLRAVQAEFDDYKLQSSAEIKKMRDAHENLSHAKTDLDVRATRLQTSLDGLTERNRLLTSQLDDARAEATQLRTEADARMRSLSASETRLADLGTQVADLRATLDAKEGEIRLLRAERDSLAVKEAALVAENGSMLGVQGDLREQLARLQKMFDDCDRDKRELGMQSREKIQALEGQIDMIRAQLVAAQDDARIRSLRYETSIGDARYQIERLNAQLADAVRIREVTQVDAARIQQHANDLQSRLMAAEQEVHQLNAQLQTPQSEQLREARAEVSKLRSDLAAAEVAVEAQRAHSEQYKAIAAASESNLAERLAEFSATYDRFKEETEEKVRVLEGDKSQAERLKREAEASLQSLGERLSREKSGLLAELVSLKTVHADLESKAGRLENAERVASVTIQSLHDELSALQSRLNESRGAYERVVANEAERIKDVGKLKGDLEAARNEASNLSEQLFSLEAEFHAREGVLVLTKSKLDSELDALKKANEDLLVQNRILHNQFETISVRVTAVYDASRDDGTFSQLSSNENEEHERLELIRHLRRDKDTLAHECELSRQTIENLRQQNNLLQKSLDEARAKLEQELQSNRSVKEIEALHKELLGKIDRVNVLTESNSTLRHSNNVMSRELEVLKSRLKEKELENTPLIEQNNNLLAENDAFKEQVNHLQAENAKLLGRANEILGKHNRVDPAEHQALKDEVLSLKEKLSQAELRVTASLDDFATFKRSSESQAASHAGQMFEIKERLKGAQAETEKLRRDLDGKKHEIEAAVQAEVMKSDAMRKDLTTRSNDIIKRYKADLDILKATKQKLQDELEQLQKASSTLETEKIDWLNTNKNLENENAKLRTELESTPVSSSSGLVVSSGPNLAVSISEPASAVTTEVTVAAVTESSVPSSSSSLVQNQDPPIPSSPSPSTKRSREEDPAAPKITPITFDDNSDDAAVSSSVAATELSEPNTKRVRMDSSAVENEIHSSNPPNNASSTVVSTPLLMAVPVKIQRSLTPVPPTVMSSAVPAPLSSAPTSAATPKIVSSVETPVAPTRSSLNDLLAKKMAALKPQLQSPQLNPEPTAHGTTTITSTSTPGSLPATTAPIVSASSVSSSPAAGAAPSLFGIPSIFVPPKPPATAQQARVRPARTESLTETGTPGPTPGRPRPRPYATAAQVRVINQPNQQLQYQNSPGRNAAGRPAVRLQRLPRSAGGGTPTQPSPTSAQTQRVVAGGVRPHPRPAQGQ